MAKEGSSPENKGNPLSTILILLNTLGIGLIGFFFFKHHKQEASRFTMADVLKAEKEEQEKQIPLGMAQEKEGILFPLEAFTTNLAPGDGPRRFIWLSPVLKFSKESNEEEFKSRGPQIRDAIISTLNSKKPEDLLKIEGKSYLKEEIKAAINSFLIDGAVIDVYYIGFKVN